MKKRALRRENRELDAALAETLELHWRENKANTALRDELRRERSVIAALCNGSQRLRKERDAALADVAELLRDEEASTSCIRDLRRFVAQLQEERDELRLELAGMTSDVALDAALADVETLTQANAEADATIGELRKGLETLQAQHSAVSDALDLEREHSAMTISKLRDDLAKARGELERVTESWQHAEDLLQERERELDALRDQQAQQEHAEPVVTLQAIEELEEGEQLIDEDGVVIECEHYGYSVSSKIGTPYLLPNPQATLNLYEQLKAKTMQ